MPLLGLGLVAWIAANGARLGAAPTTPTASFLPPPAVLHVASVGHPRAAASLLWTDLSARWAAQARLPADVLSTGVRTIGALDPEWTTPWVYGALMLEAQGDRDAHEALLALAMDVHADEHVFPYMLGMSRLSRGDRVGAATWLDAAATRPGAPALHAAAAAALRARTAP
jgi:hypothetical protein